MSKGNIISIVKLENVMCPKPLPEGETEQASDRTSPLPEKPGVTKSGFKSKYTFPIASLAEYVS